MMPPHHKDEIPDPETAGLRLGVELGQSLEHLQLEERSALAEREM